MRLGDDKNVQARVSANSNTLFEDFDTSAYEA
jgi:hypothetical protein